MSDANTELGVWRILGKRWTLPILKSMGSEAMRFCEIKKALSGISSTMLTDRLRELEREGLVEKKIDHSKAEYRLTASAKELESIIIEIDRWHAKHHAIYQPLIAN